MKLSLPLLTLAVQTGLSCLGAWGAEWRVPVSHPRLFIQLDDVAALRVRCGVGGQAPPAGQGGGFGTSHDDYQRLREVAEEIMQAKAGRDDLFVPAILHLVSGPAGRPDVYTEYVADELTDSRRGRIGLDGLVALDWCWEALDAATRVRILDRLADQIEPLDVSVSPLDPLAFGRRLEGLAAAIALNDQECREHSSLLGRLAEIRSGAGRYFTTFFSEVLPRARGDADLAGQRHRGRGADRAGVRAVALGER